MSRPNTTRTVARSRGWRDDDRDRNRALLRIADALECQAAPVTLLSWPDPSPAQGAGDAEAGK